MPAQFGAEQLFCVLNFIRDSDMNEHEKILCYTLIQYRNFEKDPEKKRDNPNDAWPSIDRLASQCGVSRRTLQYAMEGLVGRGLVTKIPRLGQSNVFRLNMDKWERVQGVHPCTKNTRAPHAQGVCTMCTGDVQEMHEGGAPRAHRTNKENKLREQINEQAKSAPALFEDKLPKTRAKKGEAWKKWIKVEKPAEVPDDLWKQFGEIRALKKMALTERALEILRSEGEKARMTLLQVVETCCGNGWAGFKASWLTKGNGSNYRKPQNITQTPEYRERLQACCRGEGRKENLADDGVTIIVD